MPLLRIGIAGEFLDRDGGSRTLGRALKKEIEREGNHRPRAGARPHRSNDLHLRFSLARASKRLSSRATAGCLPASAPSSLLPFLPFPFPLRLLLSLLLSHTSPLKKAIYFCATCALEAGAVGPSAATVACNFCAGLSPASPASGSARRSAAASRAAAAAAPAPPCSPASAPHPHRGHALVRVRRAAYADAVLFSDAATFEFPSGERRPGAGGEGGPAADAAGGSATAALLLRLAQSYRINGHRVVMLRARRPPTAPPPSGNRCVTCGSGAADGHSACSLQCLLSSLGSGRVPPASRSSPSALAALASADCSHRGRRRSGTDAGGLAPSFSPRALPRHAGGSRCPSPANSSTSRTTRTNRSSGKENGKDDGSSGGTRWPPLSASASASASAAAAALAPQAPVTPPRTEARLPPPLPFPGDVLELGGGLPPLVLSKAGAGNAAGGGGGPLGASWEHSPASSANDLAAAGARVQDHLLPPPPPLAPGPSNGERKRPGAPLAGAPAAPHLRRSPSPPPSPPAQQQQQQQLQQRQQSRALASARSGCCTLSEADALNGATAFGCCCSHQQQQMQQQMQAQKQVNSQTARRGIPLYGRRRSASICSCPPPVGAPSSAALLHKGGGAAALHLPVTLRPLNLRARDKKQGSPSRSALD